VNTRLKAAGEWRRVVARAEDSGDVTCGDGLRSLRRTNPDFAGVDTLAAAVDGTADSGGRRRTSGGLDNHCDKFYPKF